MILHTRLYSYRLFEAKAVVGSSHIKSIVEQSRKKTQLTPEPVQDLTVSNRVAILLYTVAKGPIRPKRVREKFPMFYFMNSFSSFKLYTPMTLHGVKI